MLHGLYVLTDERIPHAQWPERIEQVIRGGAQIIQLRDKKTEDETLLPIAQTISEICRDHSVLLIVNDRLKLAQTIDADGVHLGGTDTNIEEARTLLGKNKIIGASCYNQIERADEAHRQGADYLAFGSLYPSNTKPDAARCSIATLKEAKQKFSLPICAIGGINASNAQSLIDAQADMLAIGQAIFCAENAEHVSAEIAGLYL